MPKIAYKEYNPTGATLVKIKQANNIIDEYAAKGFDLTLRQLYYQFVTRDLIPNKQTEYDKLGAIVTRARLAGLMDWNAIIDRTRNLMKNTHWRDPGEIIKACARSFMVDRWGKQSTRVEVWIEKDALVGVIQGICNRMDVPYFSCRGYTSLSEMWRAAMRIKRHMDLGQDVVVIHLGDHDPSGKDMTRDIIERLKMFIGPGLTLYRKALNMDQVEELGLPPNPAKITDSRAKAYIAQYGNSSWELDALDPEYLAALIRRTVNQFTDEKILVETLKLEREMIKTLEKLAKEHGE